MEPERVQNIDYSEGLDTTSRIYFSEDPMEEREEIDDGLVTKEIDSTDLDVSVVNAIVGQERMAAHPSLDHSVVSETSPSNLDIHPENEFLLGPHNLYTFQDSLYYSDFVHRGMTVTSGVVNIKKDQSNLIGISIGGGAPLCPCLYIVQVFDNTPASREGTLQSGDELVGVNGQSVKGKTKVEVAKMIQACKEEVNIKYNKLHADPSQGKSLDIILKKVKHRLVENMSTSTADALGLSRAILCNDTLVKKLQELESTETMYRGLVDHSKRVMKAFYGLLQVYKAFGDAFAGIGVREPQPRASEAFRAFGDYHRLMEKNGVQTLKTIKPILSDLGTYLNKAIPDTKLTIRKYADAKFEYLSYCLKVKEMDDEEYSYAALQEPLYRVETGNYEYRLILRCRQEARARFARLRSDVLVKLELLDSKHVEDVVRQLHRFASQFAKFYEEAKETLAQNALFPIEMDLARSAFQYNSTNQQIQYEDDDDDDMIQDGIEAVEDTPTPLIADLIEPSADNQTQLELLGESLAGRQLDQTPLGNLLGDSQVGQTSPNPLQRSQPPLANLQTGQPQNPGRTPVAQLPCQTLPAQADFASFPDLLGQKPQTESAPSNPPATLPIDSLIADLTPLQINNEPAVGTLIGLD